MPLRYHRRLSILPGLRLNLSKSGASVSVGHRGAWLTVGPRGRRVTVGWPGTGLFWTESQPLAPPVHHGHRLAFAIVVVAPVAVVWWLASA